MLPLAQLRGGLEAAERRMRLQPARMEEEDETAEPDTMPAMDHGVESLVQSEEDMRTSSRFWERSMPGGNLVGWRVQCVYEYKDGLQWAEGFVLSQRMLSAGERNIHVYFDDGGDDYFRVPDLDVAFHTAGASAKVSARVLSEAQAQVVLE